MSYSPVFAIRRKAPTCANKKYVNMCLGFSGMSLFWEIALFYPCTWFGCSGCNLTRLPAYVYILIFFKKSMPLKTRFDIRGHALHMSFNQADREIVTWKHMQNYRVGCKNAACLVAVFDILQLTENRPQNGERYPGKPTPQTNSTCNIYKARLKTLCSFFPNMSSFCRFHLQNLHVHSNVLHVSSWKILAQKMPTYPNMRARKLGRNWVT